MCTFKRTQLSVLSVHTDTIYIIYVTKSVLYTDVVKSYFLASENFFQNVNLILYEFLIEYILCIFLLLTSITCM